MKVNHNHISNTGVNDSEDILEAQDEISIDNNKNQESIWNKKSIFHTWLLLCYSTGPVASMSRTYIPASIQSIAKM